MLVFALPYAAALAVRRRWPVTAAIVACGALLAVVPLGLVHATGGVLTIPYTWTPFLLAYSLGAGASAAVGLGGAALLALSVQLTNAFKHAPGAPVDVAIRGHGAGVDVNIVNAAPRHERSGLERSGGSYGLAGMRGRVVACGGSLTSGPTAAGGWRVSVLLPGQLT